MCPPFLTLASLEFPEFLDGGELHGERALELRHDVHAGLDGANDDAHVVAIAAVSVPAA